jgi:flagellar basal-body rod protein FlgC
MIDAVSSALAGISAATRRFEAAANNIANQDSRGALPTNIMPGAQQPYQPVRVEQVSTPSGGPAASLRSTTPAYLAVYDPQSSDADGNGFVAQPNVDTVEETTQEIEANAQLQANLQILQATDAMVRRLYDLG